MAKKPQFVDVAVPLAIPNLLTYAAEEPVEPGMRVVVTVGPRRKYTGLVWRVHDQAPPHSVKPVDSVVDESPIATPEQLAMWAWMADYYMCTRGEVVAAAMPPGLKLASKTSVQLHPRVMEAGGVRSVSGYADLALNDRRLLEALEARKVLSLVEIGKVIDVLHPQRHVARLLRGDWIMTEEEVKSRYTPKLERVVALDPALVGQDERLNDLLDRSERTAPKRFALLLALLSRAADGAFVPEKEVLAQADVSASVVAATAEKGWVVRAQRAVDPEEVAAAAQQALPVLSPAQSRAYDALSTACGERKSSLFHGVTGSGKTEVYVHLIADALERGEQVLFLVPEIALTTQLIGRLRRHFDAYISVYHSRFTSRERTETWMETLAVNRGRRGRLVVGPRSAMHVPLPNLGLILVDEEHEQSFKQHDPAPRYQARDVALWMARQRGIPCVLGSATPSVETAWHAKEGRLAYVALSQRFGKVQLPEIQCADLRKELKQRSMKGHFSMMLRTAMEEAFAAGRQVILFQNRRGYSPMWLCDFCAWTPECPRCDLPLTLHKSHAQLNCHHCGYQLAPPPHACDQCGSTKMKPKGLGTQRIEEEIAEMFPRARVLRMDQDSTRSKHSHARMVQAFAAGEYDVLVGTQMVSKGLDFERVGLVGVMSADRMLNFPHFRSFERAYQMLTQVAGRAGRSGERGRVVIQTFVPDHWVLSHVMEHDYAGLARHELLERKELIFPPYCRLIRLVLRHTDVDVLVRAAEVLGNRLKQRFGARVHGPEVPALERVNLLYHRVVLLKFERDLAPAQYKALLAEDLAAFAANAWGKRIRVTVDVDPA